MVASMDLLINQLKQALPELEIRRIFLVDRTVYEACISSCMTIATQKITSQVILKNVARNPHTPA
jgi:hypothetical protein